MQSGQSSLQCSVWIGSSLKPSIAYRKWSSSTLGKIQKNLEMAEDSFVFVCVDENAKEDGVELPVEDDGTILLSVLQSQFSGASGLKYR